MFVRVYTMLEGFKVDPYKLVCPSVHLISIHLFLCSIYISQFLRYIDQICYIICMNSRMGKNRGYQVDVRSKGHILNAVEIKLAVARMSAQLVKGALTPYLFPHFSLIVTELNE